MVDVSQVGIVSMPIKVGVGNVPQKLSEDVWFGIGTIGTLLVAEQSSFENHSRGGG